MTTEQFLQIDINQISQCYLGKDHHCRCGCGGDYTATSFMKTPRSEVNDALVEKRLNRAKSLVRKGSAHNIGETYINIPTGKNKALTFYWDELK